MNKKVALLFCCSVAAAAAMVSCGGGSSSGSSSPAPAPGPPPPPPPPGPPPPPPPPSTGTPTLVRTPVMNASEPWDLAFVSDGTMFFTEKCRGLSVRRTNGTVARLFGTTGSAVVANDLFCEGQTGMHGVAIDPDFANNRFVYVYMPSNLTSPRSNFVVRVTVDTNYSTVTGRADIVRGISFKTVNIQGRGTGQHSGGRIRFGPDNLLYITTGDNHTGSLPQNVNALGGKVLRVNADGNAAAGNNSPGDPRIFTYGHRNVQGIAFRPGSGQPFISEHGPGHNDEVTALVPGGNGGWDPQNRSGAGFTCIDGYCGYEGTSTTMPMTDTTRFPNAMRPAWNNGGASEGTGPSTFLSGPQWKDWNGRLAVGIMGGQRIEILHLDANGNSIASTTASSLPSARMRSLVQGPDGNLYVATDGGEIWRVVPQ